MAHFRLIVFEWLEGCRTDSDAVFLAYDVQEALYAFSALQCRWVCLTIEWTWSRYDCYFSCLPFLWGVPKRKSRRKWEGSALVRPVLSTSRRPFARRTMLTITRECMARNGPSLSSWKRLQGMLFSILVALTAHRQPCKHFVSLAVAGNILRSLRKLWRSLMTRCCFTAKTHMGLRYRLFGIFVLPDDSLMKLNGSAISRYEIKISSLRLSSWLATTWPLVSHFDKVAKWWKTRKKQLVSEAFELFVG